MLKKSVLLLCYLLLFNQVFAKGGWVLVGYKNDYWWFWHKNAQLSQLNDFFKVPSHGSDVFLGKNRKIVLWKLIQKDKIYFSGSHRNFIKEHFECYEDISEVIPDFETLVSDTRLPKDAESEFEKLINPPPKEPTLPGKPFDPPPNLQSHSEEKLQMDNSAKDIADHLKLNNRPTIQEEMELMEGIEIEKVGCWKSLSPCTRRLIVGGIVTVFVLGAFALFDGLYSHVLINKPKKVNTNNDTDTKAVIADNPSFHPKTVAPTKTEWLRNQDKVVQFFYKNGK